MSASSSNEALRALLSMMDTVWPFWGNACINSVIMRDRGGWIHSLVLTEPHLYLWDKTLWFSHKEETDNDITVNVASSPFTECYYFYCQLHKDIPWADVSVCVCVCAGGSLSVSIQQGPLYWPFFISWMGNPSFEPHLLSPSVLFTITLLYTALVKISSWSATPQPCWHISF